MALSPLPFARNRGLAALILAILAMGAGSAAAQSADTDARAALPPAARERGTLRVATALSWAPFAYKSDDDQATGIDISLMQLIAAKLGLKAEINDLKFPAIVPGVQTGRFDVGVDQLEIIPDRVKVVDMIPYTVSGYSILGRKGGPRLDPANLCGATMVVTQGSAQARGLETLSGKCTGAGRTAITQILYPDTADTVLALANGRGEGFMSATPQAVYAAQTNRKLEVMAGEVPDLPRSTSGIVVAKDDAAMHKAVAQALQSAIKDGSYQAVLDKYSVSKLGVTADQVQ